MSRKLPSDTFCILPWLHFYHDTTGRVQPCCSTDYQHTDYGNVRDYPDAQALMNTDQMKQLRLDMLEGRRNPSCVTCHREEDAGIESFRRVKNRLLQEYPIDLDQLVKRTDPDGYLNDFKLQYWDARFSNVCNLKCRMCGHKYSHTWGSDAAAMKLTAARKNYVIHAFDQQDFADYIHRYGDFSELKEVYFAGGESLLQKDHWDMLDHLVSIGKTDVKLIYNTNLTKLNYGQRYLTTYLEKFRDVTFITSVDATGDLFEYIRTGASWQTFVENLNVIQQYPNVTVKFNCAVSIYNILRLGPLFSFVIDRNIQNRNLEWLLDLSPVHYPEHLSIRVLPDSLKFLTRGKLRALSEYPQFKTSIEGLIKFMYSKRTTNDEWLFHSGYAKDIDRVRSENLLDLVPEFKEYWTSADLAKTNSI